MIWGDILKENHNNDFIPENEEMVDISGDKESVEKIYNKRKSGAKRYSDKKGRDKSDKLKLNENSAGSDEFVDISQPSDSGKRFKSKSLQDSGSKKTKYDKKKIAIISSVVAAVVLVVVGVTGFVLFNPSLFSQNGNSNVAETSYVFRFTEGTMVSGVSIGNKTFEQAKEILENNKDKFVTPISISINADDEVIQFTEKDFEYTYDIDEVLNTIKADETKITKNSSSKTSPSLNTGTTESITYSVTATVTKDSVDKKIKDVEERVNKEAVNACVSEFTPYSDERFKYAEAQKGRKIDIDDLTQKINGFFEKNETEIRIQAEVESVDADIQLDDVKKNIVKLAKYETVSYNTANGTSNMKVSLEACNGSVIEPGAVWSFNKCTGDSNLESNGYLPAHVISDGELVDGIGGGICQSSSTIYNAAIRANMEVDTRYNHKWASSYVPTGLDATIDYPNLDLKLKNPTDYQMFIECKLYDSNVLTVTIWGYKSSSYDEIITENKMLNQSSDSYTVEAFRVYLKDGKEIDRESLGKSTYDLDSSHGVVFYDADNDNNAKSVGSSTEETIKKPASSQVDNANEHSSAQHQESSRTESVSTQSSAQQQETEPVQSSEVHTQPPAAQTQPPEVDTSSVDQNSDS